MTRAEFNSKADRLRSNTLVLSVHSDRRLRQAGPEYDEILAAGSQVLAFLGQRMIDEPSALWLYVATRICGAIPCAVEAHMPVEDGFRRISVVDACRAWGRRLVAEHGQGDGR